MSGLEHYRLRTVKTYGEESTIRNIAPVEVNTWILSTTYFINGDILKADEEYYEVSEPH